jgi:hypothetical protein
MRGPRAAWLVGGERAGETTTVKRRIAWRQPAPRHTGIRREGEVCSVDPLVGAPEPVRRKGPLLHRRQGLEGCTIGLVGQICASTGPSTPSR